MAFVPVYILILGFTIVIDYFAGIFVEKSIGKKRKSFLIISLIANIGVLAVFKYYNFLNEHITQLLGIFHQENPIPYLSILLPIGLSFHTFQAMSYTIEVYRGNQKAERHFGIYALYVMFYPQLVAGPIERPQNILHQFYEKHKFNYQNVTDGLKLMAWGLFKKVVIADRLSFIVNQVYDSPADYHGTSLLIAAVFFSFQIYCDFSGYSDIAIGAARVMGFNLVQNFNTPYFATSLTEFWRRWHISLSSWFRDYVYIPLGGNRVTLKRFCFNILLVFALSGLWHGAKYTFIIWGAIHGILLIYETLTRQIRSKISENIPTILYSGVSILFTFACVTLCWIFFRATSISEAFIVIKNMFDGRQSSLPTSSPELFLAVFSIIFLLFCEWAIRNKGVISFINSHSTPVRWLAYTVLVLLILNFGVFGGSSFIYFQF